MKTRSRRAGLVLALVLATASLSGCSIFAAPLAAQQDKAVAATAQLDLATAVIAAESFAVGNNGSYPTTSAELKENGYKPSPGMSDVRILVGQGEYYCLSVTADSGEIFKYIASSSTYTSGECTPMDAG